MVSAGSGSLGFEALSRQAAKVRTFLELEKAVAQQLSKNIQTLKCADRAQVVNQNSLHFLNQPQNQPHFDVVFLDPPFHFNLAEQAMALLAQTTGYVRKPWFMETEKARNRTYRKNWHVLKQKDSGQVSYRLYQAE